MSSLYTKERKAKLRIAAKEFNYELLNLVATQYKMKKLDLIRQKQIIEIDEMYDKIEEFKDVIEYLTISLVKKQ